MAGTGEEQDAPSIVVVAPAPLLTVTIEAAGDASEVHLHAGGQGVWLARMATVLGARVTLCGPFGGEAGSVVADLVEADGTRVRAVATTGSNGSYVHDRRGGERREIVDVAPAPLSRHEVDDLYGVALVEALEADACILSGAPTPGVLPDDTFRRLCADLRANGRTVVADLSGDQLRAALEGGVHLLKVSHEELLEGGWAKSDAIEDLVAAMEGLAADGARHVVVSRAGEAALALLDGAAVTVTAPALDPVDHRGAGDSMTAGLAVGIARDGDLERAVRLGAAAGSLNVTRRGLATGDRHEIERFAAHVTIEPLER